MKIDIKLFLFLFCFFTFQQTSFAQAQASSLANPTSCVKGVFSKSGSQHWSNITLKLTNQCGIPVDFQNSRITFINSDNLNTSFWGNFNSLTYPDNNLQITSQPNTDASYLASFSLHFPEQSWANTTLANQASITISYGSSSAGYVESSVQVYLNDITPPEYGSIQIQNSSLPSVITGYSGTPVATLTSSEEQTTFAQSVQWNSVTTVENLTKNVSYTLTTPNIQYNGYTCVGSFNPTTLVSSSTTAPSSQLSYSCTQDTPPAPVDISVSVSGLPASTATIQVTLTPSDSSSAIMKTISLSGGQGSSSVSLMNNLTYSVTSTAVNGYSVNYNPKTITPVTGGTAAITYSVVQPSAGGRIIGYLPGWKTPPAATDLANAGYTHILVAFGVFSTTQPGQIVSAFDTVSKDYIASLKNAGIKVLLSLGGALTSIPGTSVDFHAVLTQASSPAAFQQTFIQSIENMVSQYGFDGFDIDIEHGINGGGTFAQPTGDIAVLANIINGAYIRNPNLLITMAPQVANISATSGFDATWGNYASLIMQTYSSLSWVGIQLYNTGCAFGIDQVCYDPNTTSSPNFTVAMATDLLANWPALDSTGRRTGFQPYISYLNPSQVVVGYPSPNRQGQSDGAPVTPNSTIKRAIQCLRTATSGSNSCGTYVPPKAYPGIGGVFNWEVTYDQDSNFQFANGLKECVRNGNCQ
jgi:chitinase